jgi:putative CocE/NonD family hydrolase
VAPVDDDPQGVMLKQAVAEHRANYNVYETAKQFSYADDVSQTGLSSDHFSPHAFLDQIKGSGTAVYCWSGYYDGGYTRANIKRYLNINNPGKKLVLGPWDHGNVNMIDPTETKGKVKFDDLGEIIRFFDYHLKSIDNGIGAEAPIHYYTMGEGYWKTADSWPPPGFQETPFYFGPRNSLIKGEKSPDSGVDSYQVDFNTGSGDTSRWVSLVNIAGKKIGYPNRRQTDEKLLIYQTAALEQALEVTGHPILTLFVKSSDPDPLFFIYLEDVTPEGEVWYVTEGQIRGLHRKINTAKPAYSIPVPSHSYRREDALPLAPDEAADIVFDLQPVSYLFQVGHFIRVSIAGADKDNFEILPETAPKWEIIRTAENSSHIVLPLRVRES